MKAILIDSKNRTVSSVEVPQSNQLKAYYQLLDCECVTVIDIAVEKNHSLYLDDEALINNHHQTGFSILGQTFVGNGLILGFDPQTGSSISVSVTPEYIAQLVTFVNRDEIDDTPIIKFYSFEDVINMVFAQMN